MFRKTIKFGEEMRVLRVDISRFRGVNKTSLESCGDLNVLVGKNNSGKSTVLEAIDGFFAVVSPGSLVAIGEGPLRYHTDFRRGDDTEQSFTISMNLGLTEVELEQIIEGVTLEAPQMKHALEAKSGDCLRIEVTSERRGGALAYVSQIALVDAESGEISHRADRILLTVSRTVAEELRDKAVKARESEMKARAMLDISRHVDSDDFKIFKREGAEFGAMMSARLRRFASIGNPDLTYEVESIVRHSENYPDFRERLQGMVDAAKANAKRIEAEPLEHPITTFSGDSPVVPTYAFDILKQIGSTTVLHLRDRREPVGKEEARRLLALKTRRKGPEVLRNIQETVKSLLGVSIDAFESERTSLGRAEASAEMDVDEVLVEMNGAGIREALRLILDNELGSPALLLVEEPEVHLHPALESSMLRYLKEASARAQIFLTTHSTNFLDTTEMRNVYLARRDPWVEISLLDYEQAEASIPDELGLRLSSVFMYDRLVFVEGATDEAVFRELAPLIDVNFGQRNVGFVAMGSVRNFAHYASTATLDLLSKRRVKMFFILDRDESSEQDVLSLHTKLGGLAELHVLEKREIENYLAVPRAMVDFIRHKRDLERLEATAFSEESIAEALDACADDLKDIAIQKRVLRSMSAPVYLDGSSIIDASSTDNFARRLTQGIEDQAGALKERISEIEQLVAKEREHVESNWAKTKLDIVPGDELLDAVCVKFGVRFKKRRDGARLAGLLEASDLPTELTDLMKRLVG